MKLLILTCEVMATYGRLLWLIKSNGNNEVLIQLKCQNKLRNWLEIDHLTFLRFITSIPYLITSSLPILIWVTITTNNCILICVIVTINGHILILFTILFLIWFYILTIHSSHLSWSPLFLLNNLIVSFFFSTIVYYPLPLVFYFNKINPSSKFYAGQITSL